MRHRVGGHILFEISQSFPQRQRDTHIPNTHPTYPYIPHTPHPPTHTPPTPSNTYHSTCDNRSSNHRIVNITHHKNNFWHEWGSNHNRLHMILLKTQQNKTKRHEVDMRNFKNTHRINTINVKRSFKKW